MINEQIKAGYKLLAILKGNPEIIEESKSLNIENPFYNEETNTLYRLWREDMEKKTPVLALLSASKKFKEIYPNATTIQEIRSCGGEFHNWKTYDHQVFEGWAKSKLSRLGAHLIQGQTTAEDAENLLLTANETITAIDEHNNCDEEVSKSDSIMKALEEWTSEYNGDLGDFLPTGIDGLDKIIKGFKKGTMSVLGARPANGKTALGLSIMNNMVNEGIVCGFVSVEMDATECFQRLACIESEISNEAPEKQDQQGFLELAKALGSFQKKDNCIIRHSTNRRISNIKRIVRSMKKENKDLEIIFVDYLQKVESDQKGLDPRNAVTEVSGIFTDIAKDLGIHVSVMAQFNRGADEKLPPQMSHLKESSAIEQDAHLVIGIYRNMDAQKDASANGSTDLGIWRKDGNVISEPQDITDLQCYLSVLKNRSGKQGFAKCRYNATSTKFKSDDQWKQGDYFGD